MKKATSFIMLAAFLIGGLAGCYDDKGNYDYHDINEMTVTLLARNQDGRPLTIGENGQCRYKQTSSVDTMRVIYTPEVYQTQRQDESNLEYLWKVAYTRNDSNVIDLVHDKELTLVFPPQQRKQYNVTFSVTDLSTNVSRYLSLAVQTVQPYRYAWFVLNGKEGDRQISTIEDPDSTEYIYTIDAYMDLGNARRFQDATGLLYSPVLNSYSPALQIFSKDSIWMMSPFDMKVYASNNKLLPSEITDNKAGLLFGRDGGVQDGRTILVADNHKMYYCSNGGRYTAFNSQAFPSYRVDMMSETNESLCILFWDSENEQMMFMDQGLYVNPWWDRIEDFDFKTPLWMGQSCIAGKDVIGMAILMDKDGACYAYHFDYENGHTEYQLGNDLNINMESQFATNPAFDNLGEQLFYTSGSKLYRLNLKSREAEEIYDAKGQISKLKFRVNQKHSLAPTATHWYHCLAIVVNTESTGELHEIVFENNGDINPAKTKVFTGFGPIADICYTFINALN